MDAIKLDFLPAMSHSWHSHAQSWLIVRVAKTIVNGFKAIFGSYSVSLLDNVTLPLIRRCPDARSTNFLRTPLSSRNIRIPEACSDQVTYLSDKVRKLCKTGRELMVRIAFKEDGVEAIPMYFSQNEESENLNGKAYRSRVFHDLPGSEKIVCRHLSFAYAKGLFGRGKASFETINTPDKIRTVHANVNNCPAGEYPHREGYYFSTDKFPEAVEALVTKHWNLPDGTEKSYLIGTPNHAMALRLKKKGGCMKAIFYEPNDTLRHKTFILSDPSKARHLKIHDFDFYDWQDGAIVDVEPVDNWNRSSDTTFSREGREKLAQADVKIFGDPSRKNLTVLAMIYNHSRHSIIKTELDKSDPYRRRRYSNPW